MRVLFFLRSFPVVSETFIIHQIEGVIGRGHEVLVTADRPSSDVDAMHHEQLDLRVRTLYRRPGRPNRFLRGLQTAALALDNTRRAPGAIWGSLNVSKYGREARSGRLLRALVPLLSLQSRSPHDARTLEPDVVHAHFGPAGVIAAMLKELGVIRAPLVVTFHGYDANVVPRRMGSGYYDLLFKSAKRIMVGTEFMRGRLLELGAPADRLIKLPMGVNTKRFDCKPGERKTKSSPIVLSVGRLVGNKGFRDGIVAFQAASAQHPDAEYWIAGDGPERTILEKTARELKIADRVSFLGNQSQEQLLELYAHVGIFLHPSKVGEDGSVEGQGLVLAEAAASGLPIVATGLGGIPETVINQKNGFLAAPGDFAALATHLAALLDDPALRVRMGARGRRLVEEKFEQSRLDDELMGVYEDVL